MDAREVNAKRLQELGYSNERIELALSQTDILEDAIGILNDVSSNTAPDLNGSTPPQTQPNLINEPFHRIEMEEVPGALDMNEDPPPYEEIDKDTPTHLPEGLHSVPEEAERGPEGQEGTQEAFEFPVSNLYELEGRCFIDNWSIPYKKTESLGILLQASARLALEGTSFLILSLSIYLLFCVC